VATRKSLACRKPPNGTGWVSTATTRSGPNEVDPGFATRSSITNVSGKNGWTSIQLT
jgi:hypothetical protein